MKKVALSLLAFGLVGAMAFADNAAPTVAIHDWGRQLFVVGNQDSSGYYAGLGTSWGASPRIVGLNITADAGNAGFSITPSADNGTFSLTDQNKAWIKPMDGVTVEMGYSLETDTWRGTADYGTWDWLRLPGTHGDSFTFNRIGEGGSSYSTAVEYNKDGIGAWALVQGVGSNGQGATTDIGHALQAGAAYTIAGVGVIKAQVVGAQVAGAGPLAGNSYSATLITPITNADGTKTTSIKYSTASAETSTYQFAFNLQAVQNLYEEVGVWVPSDGSKAGWSYQISDYASYKLGAPTVHARALVTGYNGKNNSSGSSILVDGIGLEIGGGVDYDLGNSITAAADVSYVNKAQYNSGIDVTKLSSTTYSGLWDKDMTGFTATISKGFANGMIGIGFEYSTVAWNGGNTTGTSPDKAHWAIPVKMEEWF